MLLRIALFTLLGLGIAGFGGIAWVSLRGTAPAAQAAGAPPARVTVLVAAHGLQAGNLLKPDDVGTRDISAATMPEGAWTDTPEARTALLGAMIRRSLLANEPLLPADVMRPGDHGFLAAVLGPGMRAVSVGVDAVSGTAGLIWPGDRVDLILTQQQEDQSLPLARRVSGETVLHYVRVIAIDQQLVQGASSSAAGSQLARTVTLEVTPAQAERVSVATRLGHLSLVVCSADDKAPAPAADASTAARPQDSVTWGGDVSTALRDDRGTDGQTVRVFQGAADSKEYHF